MQRGVKRMENIKAEKKVEAKEMEKLLKKFRL